MKVSWDIAGNASGYGTEKTTQTKPFVIPMQSEAKAGGAAKAEPARSDEEILKDVEELAREHARAGQFQSGSRFEELKNEYISSVSPDREGILKSKSNEIRERLAAETYPAKIAKRYKKNDKERIDYLLELFAGKAKDPHEIIKSNIATRGNSIAAIGGMHNVKSVGYAGSDIAISLDYGGGKTTTLTYGSLGEFIGRSMKGDMYDIGKIENGAVKEAIFYDSNGEEIMRVDGDKIIQIETKAEKERRNEMLGAYSSAYEKMRSEMG